MPPRTSRRLTLPPVFDITAGHRVGRAQGRSVAGPHCAAVRLVAVEALQGAPIRLHNSFTREISEVTSCQRVGWGCERLEEV